MQRFNLNEYHKIKKINPTKVTYPKSISKQINHTKKNTEISFNKNNTTYQNIPSLNNNKKSISLKKIKNNNSSYNIHNKINLSLQNKISKDNFYNENYESNKINSTKVQFFKKNRKLKIKRNITDNEKKINFNFNENNIMNKKTKNKNKKISIIPKHRYKLFTTTKIINNFNNQINSNHDLQKIQENVEFPTDNISLLHEMENKTKLIQRFFRKNLFQKKNFVKSEKNLVNSEKKIKVFIKDNNINDDIVSDVSLSEEELDFSKDDNVLKDFSIDDQEI